jgi:hypothetical protein
MDQLESVIQHYEYDPVKAHEYYMRTRELTGRRSTKGVNNQQRERWSFTKAQIHEEKKTKVTEESLSKKQKIEEFRAKAEQMRAKFSEDLKLFNKKLVEKAIAERARVEEKRKIELERLQTPLPKNISPEKRAAILEKRKKEIGDLVNESRSEKKDISADSKKDRLTNNKEVSTERETLRNELKSVITNARDDYKKAIVEINTYYEGVYQDEYNKTKQN